MHLGRRFTWTAEFKTPIDVSTGALGQRIVADIMGGSLTGPRLTGKVLPGGADWALVGPDGNIRLEVRIMRKTDNGAFIYVTYHARMVMNDKPQAVLLESKDSTEFGDANMIFQLHLETGDKYYA